MAKSFSLRFFYIANVSKRYYVKEKNSLGECLSLFLVPNIIHKNMVFSLFKFLFEIMLIEYFRLLADVNYWLAGRFGNIPVFLQVNLI